VAPNLSDTVTSRLREINQRLTANREAIVGVLAAAPRPLTIPEILAERDDLAQSSVYRNLVVLEQAGLVHRIVTNDEYARFELAEDLTGHHHHLICSSCGNVDDFTVPPALEEALHHAFENVAGATGFTPDDHRLDLVGTCARCD
jgi:Fe2+ or Zn2+ uptake regulation protein